MSGYSGTPLSKKLGIKEGFTILIRNAPENYESLLAPLPDDVHLSTDAGKNLQMVHFFTKSREELKKQLPAFMKSIRQDGMIWVSWPKKSSKVSTDITEDVVREVALPLGVVDVKVCAIDEIWSGLKLVTRKENRKK
jgi:hypothetical protein